MIIKTRKIMKNVEATISLLIIAMTLVVGKANETFTNWNWLSFELNVPQTNYSLGEKLSTIVTVSNTTTANHIVRWIADDSCGRGFIKFSIIEMSSGGESECKFPFDGAITLTGQADLSGHTSKSFEFDLAATYSITNAGIYSIQTTGWFPISEPATNHQYATVTTPPIIISVSPKIETNSLPK
jgi:hypothetical protein